MKKINSSFKTNFISESGSFLQNKDYFAFVELDNFACYVIADGIDEDLELESAKMAVTSIIRNFTEKPSMKKWVINKLLKEANKELICKSENLRLKASIAIVVTDYSKLVYSVAGNTRFYLFRDGILKYKSKDQSLTELLSSEEEMTYYKKSKHKERNNLYCYLGQNEFGKPYISKRIKLRDGDVFSLLTKGIWENVDEQEFVDASEGVKEPNELVDNVEDMLLSKQLSNIENYTLAITFVDKVYINPNRKKFIKKILIVLIPIIIILIIFGVVWNINRNKKIDSINEMKEHKLSAIQYSENDNPTKAQEEYKAALDIAKKYKLNPDKKVLDKQYKIMEFVLGGDAKLKDNKYEEAIDKYLVALEKSKEVDNSASKYILKKLVVARNGVKVTDLLKLGDKSLEAKNITDAEALYKKAKDLATDFYFKDEKKEAMDKLEKLYGKKADEEKKLKDKKEKDRKEKEASEDKAIENIKNGDQSYTKGDYVGAKMYYTMAKKIYDANNSKTLSKEMVERINLTNTKIESASMEKEKAYKYEKDGDYKYTSGDPLAAKILYLLSKEIYEREGFIDEGQKLQKKLNAIDKEMPKN